MQNIVFKKRTEDVGRNNLRVFTYIVKDEYWTTCIHKFYESMMR
jgi:hypothetical protein